MYSVPFRARLGYVSSQLQACCARQKRGIHKVQSTTLHNVTWIAEPDLVSAQTLAPTMTLPASDPSICVAERTSAALASALNWRCSRCSRCQASAAVFAPPCMVQHTLQTCPRHLKRSKHLWLRRAHHSACLAAAAGAVLSQRSFIEAVYSQCSQLRAESRHTSRRAEEPGGAGEGHFPAAPHPAARRAQQPPGHRCRRSAHSGVNGLQPQP